MCLVLSTGPGNTDSQEAWRRLQDGAPDSLIRNKLGRSDGLGDEGWGWIRFEDGTELFWREPE
jgi:hypothetical protein